MKAKRIIAFLAGTIVTASVYIVLSESFTPTSLIIGMLLGLGSMIVCVVFFGNDFLLRYDVRILPLGWYLISLIIIVIISGIKSIILGFKKNSTSLLITYQSTLNSDMLITLLANSITLTPGTTTIDKNGATLKVMRLCEVGSENDLSDIEQLEKMIKKAQRSKT